MQQKKIIRKNYEPSQGKALICPEQGRTKQSSKDECDINKILKRYAKTGQLPDLIKQNPQYGDFSSVPQYQDALNIVAHANEQFSSLSSNVRSRFHNDPAQFLAFTSDPKNVPEMISLGLVTERDAPPSKGKPPIGGKKPSQKPLKDNTGSSEGTGDSS